MKTITRDQQRHLAACLRWGQQDVPDADLDGLRVLADRLEDDPKQASLVPTVRSVISSTAWAELPFDPEERGWDHSEPDEEFEELGYGFLATEGTEERGWPRNPGEISYVIRRGETARDIHGDAGWVPDNEPGIATMTVARLWLVRGGTRFSIAEPIAEVVTPQQWPNLRCRMQAQGWSGSSYEDVLAAIVRHLKWHAVCHLLGYTPTSLAAALVGCEVAS